MKKRSKRDFFVVLAWVLIICFSVLFGDALAPTLCDAEHKKITFKMVTAVPGSEHDIKNHKIVSMKERIAEITNGQLQVEEYFGTLGGEKEIITGMQTGTIESCVVTAGTVGGFVKSAELLNLPFIFDDVDHLFRTLDGPYGDFLGEKFKAAGMRLLFTGFDAPRTVFTTKVAVKSLQDLQGLKIRVMETPLFVSLYKAMGAVPAPMAWTEVFMALKNGVVDGLDTSWPGAWETKLYEVTDFTFATNHVLTPILVFVAEKWFQKLPKDAQWAITQAAIDVKKSERNYDLTVIDDYIEKWKGTGHTIYEPSEADKEKFRRIGAEVTKQFYDRVGKENLDWIKSIR
jgi:tripartite ATP-independent transporter DctP family solute receptor